MFADLDSFTHGPGSEVYLYRYQYRWYRYKYIVVSYGSTSILCFYYLLTREGWIWKKELLVAPFSMTSLGTSVCIHLPIISMGLIYALLSVCQTLHRRESLLIQGSLWHLLRSRTVITPLPSGWRTFQLGHSLTESFMLLHRSKF